MTDWIRDHSPLVIVTLVAIASTVVMLVTGNHPFAVSVAGNIWGIVVLLVAFDITPRDAYEKKEQA